MMINTPQPADSETPICAYASREYAASLEEWGRPRSLAASGGWILERQIADTSYRDAMGCYPLFSCRDWSALPDDVEALRDDLVSLVILADPFGNYVEEGLKKIFKDLVTPYKEHFVVDLAVSPEMVVSENHRRNIRKALRNVTVEECERPADFLDEWVALYNVLIERHGISGLTAFSATSFAQQLEVPGITAFRAIADGATVGMVLWYVDGDRGYYHLGAYNRRGYELRASFALFNRSIESFTQRGLRWLSLGAEAGADRSDSGLSRFKRGWASSTRTAYFCGRIFDAERYRAIVTARKLPATRYFPAYRIGEFR